MSATETTVLCGTCLYMNFREVEAKHERDNTRLCLMHAKAYDAALTQIRKGIKK